MKRILILLLAAMLAGQAWAQTTFNLGDNVQGVVDGETLTISGTGNMTNFTYSSKPSFGNIKKVIIEDGVTSIGSNVFYNCSSLAEVTIGNSVTSIGSYVFYNCSGLTEVTIGNSVTSIGNYAFSGCSGLAEITIPNSVTSIGSYAFYGCIGLILTTIPETVKSIGENAFYGCSGLTSIIFAEGSCLTSIKSYAFYNCSGLTSITIPNSVTSIGTFAFENCSGLTSITIPNSVTSIGGHAFRGCSGLTSVTIPNSVTSIGTYAFYGCSGLTSVTIPNSVTSIGGYAFRGCSGLTSVTIPNSVTSIGTYAFYGCSELTSVTIPNAVTSIGSSVFRGCCKLTDINVESENTTYTSENGVLFNKEKTNLICYPAGKIETTYTIPNSVTSIGAYAFYGCIGLTSITIPETVESIGENAFYGCSGLTSVTIPNSVTRINNHAFYGCSGLTSVTIPNSVISISSYAFYGCSGLTSITIPNSVTSIGNAVFIDCSKLTDIIVESDNTKYTSENGVLFNKAKDNLICYPAGKTETTYTIPNSVTNIDKSAFYGCGKLTSVTIPKSVTSIDTDAFYGCNDLLKEYDNALYVGDTDNPYLALIQSKSTDITICEINSNCIFITNGAFYGCSKLTSVTIPNTVTSIGNSAFYDCSKLASVTIPNSVTNIGNSAFYGCSGLSSVTIPNSVTSIGSGVFIGCLGLRSVTIPNSVTSIGDNAFGHCSGLPSVSIPNSVTSIGSGAFSDCYNLRRVTIPNSVTSIGNSAFYNCSKLASVTIPNSVTSIGSSVFNGCKELISVTIPNSVTSIGNSAFSGCSKLTSVTIPNSVTSIGSSAFSNCSKSTLYCECEESAKPSNWPANWNSNRPVKWGCKVVRAEANNGSVTIDGTNYAVKGDDCSLWYLATTTNGTATITATANSVHSFIKWNDEETQNPRTINVNESISYTAIFEAHTEVPDAAVAATCTTTGKTAGKHCSVCNAILVAQTTTSALGHNYGTPTYAWAEDGSACTATAVCQRDANHIATEDATITGKETIAPTCEEMGTSTYTAKFENELFATQTKDVVDIAALGHSYGTPTYTWSADGKSCSAKTVCSRNANHEVTENAAISNAGTVAPTCEEMGTTTYTATFGNELFATQTKDVVDIDALGHDYGTPTYEWAADGKSCTATAVCQHNENHIATEDATITDEETVAPTCEEMGTTTYTATFENELFTTQTKDVVDVPANGHTPDSIVFENSVAATCTMVGKYDSVVYCSVCQAELFREEKEVAALGHTYSNAVTAPTCTEVGYTTHVCSVCDYTYNSDTVAANGHTEVVDAAVAATCTTAGKTEGKHCSVCEAVLVKQEAVAALGHTEVVDAAVAATCTTAGKTEGKHCSVCNEVIVAQTEVAAFGHNYGDYVYNNDATTEADGTETATCSRCGATDTHTAEGTKLPDATAVSESAATAVNIYAHHNIIVVENATEEIFVYDAMGQLICRDVACRIRAEINVNVPGGYIVKTGNVTKRVMVF